MLKAQVFGQNQLWAVRWYASALLNDKLTLYQGKILVQHMGADGSGAHCGDDGMGLFDASVSMHSINVSGISVTENHDALMAFSHFLRQVSHSNLVTRIVHKFQKVLKS